MCTILDGAEQLDSVYVPAEEMVKADVSQVMMFCDHTVWMNSTANHTNFLLVHHHSLSPTIIGTNAECVLCIFSIHGDT